MLDTLEGRWGTMRRMIIALALAVLLALATIGVAYGQPPSSVASQEPSPVNGEGDPIVQGEATVEGDCVSGSGEISAPASGHDSEEDFATPGC